MSDARIEYNLKQAGVTWKKEQLPPPFSTLDPATAAFADAVATFQSAKGLTADGKLGPGTFAALVPPVIEEAKPAPVVKEGMYGTIHEPPADIVMGAATPKQAEKPDLIQHGVAVEVKAKRPYKKRSKDV